MADQNPDLVKARHFLDQAESVLQNAVGQSLPIADFATALAALGTGYAQLAAAETITAQPEPIRIIPMASRGVRSPDSDPAPCTCSVCRAPHDSDPSEQVTRPQADEPCACCASAVMPVFRGKHCVDGLGPDGCGHSHAEHEAARRG